jgi:RHS repeat-associated protein
LTDLNGNVVTRYDYTPYGRRVLTSGTVNADFGFTGHYYDTASALCLALYRAYDANLGRWLSRDPIGIRGGMNLYRYANNEPFSKTDLYGLRTCVSNKTDQEKEEIRRKIRRFAQSAVEAIRQGRITDCRAMAAIFGFASKFYTPGETGCFVRDVSYILSGVNESATRSDNTQVRGFNDTGFKPEFRDNSNQVQHFGGGLWAGYQYGLGATIGHRILRPDTPQDTGLNDQSTSLWWTFRYGQTRSSPSGC